jgi:Flp pilus assembly protein TadG
MARGQALLEMALVLPILLFILLGGISVGLIVLDRYELQHAASEGAIAGASVPSQRCDEARAVARRILGRRPSSSSCQVRGGFVELTVAEELPIYIPALPNPFPLAVTARAKVR